MGECALTMHNTESDAFIGFGKEAQPQDSWTTHKWAGKGYNDPVSNKFEQHDDIQQACSSTGKQNINWYMLFLVSKCMVLSSINYTEKVHSRDYNRPQQGPAQKVCWMGSYQVPHRSQWGWLGNTCRGRSTVHSYSQTQPSLHAPLQDDTEVLVLEAGCVASEETIYDENESDNNETPLETGTQQVESLQRLLEQQSDFPATLQTELLEDARRLLQERARAAPPY